uniref:Uncharacterized protein n=1 Tax=Lactuca sativa TaxID=4236 RepID=A0A9R1WHM7_LACSA|nr:hypothetical protein LSAT_V11C100025480 [Lactuca sativa]
MKRIIIHGLKPYFRSFVAAIQGLEEKQSRMMDKLCIQKKAMENIDHQVTNGIEKALTEIKVMKRKRRPTIMRNRSHMRKDQ